MTATAYQLTRDNVKTDLQGLSVRLARLPDESRWTTKPLPHRVYGMEQSLRGSNGVSEGASIIENWLQGLAADIERWFDARQDSEIDIETEVVMFLPPLQERIVTLQALWVGPAEPFICVDDLTNDLAND